MGVGPCRTMGLPSPGLLCIHSMALLAFPCIPLYYSCYNVVLLNSARPLWACYLFPSSDSVSFTLFAGCCIPFPSWASLANLLFLGFLSPFPILLSYGPLLTLLGFPGPITLYLVLGADGSSISPLLSLLALLWACYGPFLLFYILPMVLLLLYFWAHSSPFASSRPTLWAREHSYHLGSIAFSCLLTLFCLFCWVFSLTGLVKNEPQQREYSYWSMK